MQTILGANGAIAVELAKANAAMTAEYCARLISSDHENGALNSPSSILDPISPKWYSRCFHLTFPSFLICTTDE